MGKTIIISSHILPELAEMVDEIGVIENGVLLAQGKVTDIQDKMRASRVLHIRLLDREEEAVAFLKELPLITLVLRDELGVHVHFGGRDEEQWELLKLLVSGGYKVLSFNEAQTNLEDVFLEITKGVRA